MKTAEEYALEEWTDGDGGYSPYEIAKMAFDAGLAEAQGIWKPATEKPTLKEYIIITNGKSTQEVSCLYDEDVAEILEGETAWCYLSDFLKTLPDWAKEVGE